MAQISFKTYSDVKKTRAENFCESCLQAVESSLKTKCCGSVAVGKREALILSKHKDLSLHFGGNSKIVGTRGFYQSGDKEIEINIKNSTSEIESEMSRLAV